MGAIHTNTIEGFWAIIKRAWYGSHHHYSRKYMPLYIAESCYKYNRRSSTTAFADSVRMFVGAKELPELQRQSVDYAQAARQHSLPVELSILPGHHHYSILDEIRRPDGRYQVTYAGLALYTFASDKRPGDARGEGVEKVWFAISPSGRLVKRPSTGG